MATKVIRAGNNREMRGIARMLDDETAATLFVALAGRFGAGQANVTLLRTATGEEAGCLISAEHFVQLTRDSAPVRKLVLRAARHSRSLKRGRVRR